LPWHFILHASHDKPVKSKKSFLKNRNRSGSSDSESDVFVVTVRFVCLMLLLGKLIWLLHRMVTCILFFLRS